MEISDTQLGFLSGRGRSMRKTLFTRSNFWISCKKVLGNRKAYKAKEQTTED